jgi:predicted secreted hydrolase
MMNAVKSFGAMRRRQLLLAGLASSTGVLAADSAAIQFPRDFGAHPDQHIEWWYLTGQASSQQRLFGFQVTFFRSRVDATQTMRSRFAAKQLIFAHAALTDVQGRKLWHDQRIARSSGTSELDQASFSERKTELVLRDWSLKQETGGYRARIHAGDFELDLQCNERQPILLQGKQGLSRKGPLASQFSHYYSQPQLAVRGQIRLKGETFPLEDKSQAAAWLDHEWSESLLPPDASGWDWIGMNLFDGSALTAFRLRDRQGQTLWDGGSFRAGGDHATEAPYVFSRGEALFSPGRRWKSPLSQAIYPVEWVVRTPADFYTVKALVDSQELDSRASTGAIYWEGLSDLFDSQNRHVGRGYLEMTGYAARLQI